MKRQDKLGRTLATGPYGRKPRSGFLWPARWLVTDSRRLADPLPAIHRLKPGEGVLFRHYELARPARLKLALQVAALCRRRGLVLLVAGDARLARAVNADGLHLPQGLVQQAATARRLGLRLVSAAAHDAGAVAQAGRHGVDAVLVSPVFVTASHPGAAELGAVRFAALASAAQRRGLQVYALGGITAATEKRLRHIRKAGSAGIQGMAR